MSPPVTATAYIVGAAQARALYVVLWEASLVGLPMNPAGEHDVECHYTARDLTAKLPGRSASVVQNELRWLTGNGWVINKRTSLRYLGRRINGTFHLLADLVAKQATGEERLVSSQILGIKLPGPPVVPETTRRGAGRRWTGSARVGGGELELGPSTSPEPERS